MPRGTVKWFNNAKGFGFILPDDGSGDLFAHYSSIEMDGYRTLKAGQTVTFEVSDGQKGMHACHIKPEQNQDNIKAAPPTPSPEQKSQPVEKYSPSSHKVRDKSALEELH